MSNNLKTDASEINSRLDVYLKKNFKDVSREKLKKQIIDSGVKIDEKVIFDPNYRLKENQKIEFEPNLESLELQPEPMKLDVIFENEDFLAINKPAGLVVHPGAGNLKGTLVNALISKYPDIKSVGEVNRPGIVHRLDKDTSGIIIVAKNNEFLKYIKNLFKQRKIKKEYLALVEGKLENKSGIIEKPLKMDPVRRRVIVDPNGRYAKTEYHLLKLYKREIASTKNASNGVDPHTHKKTKSTQNKNNNLSVGVDFYSLISVILHTGRTHQIRVHLASLKHPIVGDSFYGGEENIASRQFLHAKKLGFRLPNNTFIELEAEIPSDLKKVLDQLS